MIGTVNKVFSYFTLKKFPDEEINRKHLILYTLWLSYWILFTVLFLMGIFLAKNFIGVAFTYVVTSIYLFIVGWFKNSGRIEEASILFIFFSWLLFSFFSFVAGGPLGILSAFFIALIILTGVLLGEKSAIIVLIASSFTGFAYIIINHFYFTIPILFHPNELNDWLLFNLISLFVLVPVFLNLRNLKDSLNSANENSLKFQKLSESLEELVKERTKELESSNKDLKSFSYAVSHDLRGPLSSINDISALLLKNYNDQLTENISTLITKINTNSANLQNLFEELLKFFKITHQPITKIHVDMNSIVKAIINDSKSEIEKRNITIVQNNLDPCEGDYQLLSQVWINLLSNAFKYTQKQQKPQIEIGQKSEELKNIYFIKDNGIGFDANNASTTLFNEFGRLQNEFEGTGLGLALCKRIVESHGGQIWADALQNKGATFYFTIPN